MGKLNEAPTITLYMELNADSANNQVVQQALKKNAHIAQVDFVDKQQGLAQLQHSMGEQDLVSMLDSNPLPDVFVVTPKNDTPDALKALAAELGRLPMVESVKMDAEWMQTLYQIDQFVHQILWFLAITLGVAFVLVAHNTIRLQILSHREEIEITKLLGAPASFIRRPFLYLAAWQSLLSAVISLGLCWWLVRSTQPLVTAIFKPYGIDLAWRYFTGTEMAAVLVLVCGLGVAGAWLATQQHLLSFRAKR